MDDTRIYGEKELLAQIAAGSEAAFRQLYDQYQRRIYSYLFQITESHEVAEDIVQDIFLRIWAIRETLAGIDNLDGYLLRAAQNHAYNGFRKKARETLVLSYLKEADTVAVREPEQELVSKEVKLYIQSLVDRLTPQQRKVFLLSREGGLKQAEIAKVMGISVTTVKRHMVDALKFLRDEIGDSYGPQAVAIYVIFQLSVC